MLFVERNTIYKQNEASAFKLYQFYFDIQMTTAVLALIKG